MRKRIYFLLSILALFACEGNTLDIDADNLLLGNWSEKSTAGEISTFNRINELPNENYGIAFMQDGSFIERSHGWCATPPLVYSNTKGSYSYDGNIITINKNEFPYYIDMKVISLDENTLVLERVESDQESDYKIITDLWEEIEAMANSKTCEDSNNWAFTSFGAKACGGPKGYIAYSLEIDTEAFLLKVYKHFELEQEYNQKWGIASDCMMVQSPTGVNCVDGKPELIY